MNFEHQLRKLINQHGIDSEMNMADYIVAKHVIRFMEQLKDITSDLIDTDCELDESMDGDHASALASAGHGTDEDYGAFGGTD